MMSYLTRLSYAYEESLRYIGASEIQVEVPTNLYRVVALLIILGFLFALLRSSNTKQNLPPGPRPLPIIGNIFQLDQDAAHKTIQQWHAKYGPLISFRAGQRVIISVGTSKVARGLLSLRGAIHSSRPALVVPDAIHKGLHGVLAPLGPIWEKQLWIRSRFLSKKRVLSYRYLQDVESKQLLFDLLKTNDFSEQFFRLAASLTTALVYGRRLESVNDELEEIKELINHLNDAVGGVKSAVLELFPIFDRLPRFLAPWRAKGDREFIQTMRIFDEHLQHGVRTSSWNWAKETTAEKDVHGLDAENISYGLGVFLEAGIETVSSELGKCVMACLCNPVAMERVQAELDQVIGDSRLPSFDDIGSLPYLAAFTKELLRWLPITPLGIPHAPAQDDYYMGYLIPKGAIVLPNNWTIDMSEESYENPLEFRPERWLGNSHNVNDVFGFGRRRCPGKAFAEGTLFITISRLLWAYKITNHDENGNKVVPDPEKRTTGIAVRLLPFQATFQIRSEKRRAIVVAEWEGAEHNLDKINSQIESIGG